jgi:hypothetical protein
MVALNLTGIIEQECEPTGVLAVGKLYVANLDRLWVHPLMQSTPCP